MPLITDTGKPSEPPADAGSEDEDNLSYTSGSSYSYTASSASGDEGTNEAHKPEQNGADDDIKKDTKGSEIQPEPIVASTSSPEQTDWFEDVREDYNKLDSNPTSVPVPVSSKQEEKIDDEADKRSWLESDTDESYGAGDVSSDESLESEPVKERDDLPGPVVPPLTSLEPSQPIAASGAPAAPPSPSASPTREESRSPSPDYNTTNLQMSRLLMGQSKGEEEVEPSIQPAEASVATSVLQERQGPVALATIAEESKSKFTSPSEVSGTEVQSQDGVYTRKMSLDANTNIPPSGHPAAEPRRSSLSKRSSLFSSSTVVADVKSLYDSHYQSLEDEPVKPVAVPLPLTSTSEHAEPPGFHKEGNIEYIWEDEVHGVNIIVSEESPKECHRQRAIQATDAVRGKYSLLGGTHVFQFTFNDKPFGSHCSIGVCLEDAELSREGYGPVIGKDEFSWAWDIPSRMLIHDNDNLGCYPLVDPKQFIHSKILMELNLDEGTIRYMMEGVDLGLAFADLPRDQQLYPAVTLVYGNSAVTIDLLQSSDKRFKLTPGGVPPLRPVEEPTANGTSTEDGTTVDDATSESSDEENVPVAVVTGASKEESAPKNERPHIEKEKADSFTAMMNMVPAKEEMTLLRAFDKNSINGYGLNIVPNDPFTCRQRIMPSPVSKSVYHSIGSTVPLETGVHMWHIQLRKEYNCNIALPDGENIESAFTSLNPCIFIGVVNDKYKRQNTPDSSCLDENSWAWNPIQEMVFHNDKSRQYPLRKQAQTETGINLFRGIRLTLDMVQGILCYSYHDGVGWKNLGVAWNDLKGQKLYPHVWVHNAKFPVTMRYLAGNKELMEAPIDTAEANKMKDASFVKAPSFDPRVLPMYRTPEELSQHYTWNPQDCSAGITFRPVNARQKFNNFKICERDQNIPAGRQDVVRCRTAFRSGIHVWLITFDTDEVDESDQYVIGFGTKQAVANPITNMTTFHSALPSVVGSDFYSWGWDLKYHLLYHGEETRGEYPLLEPDFEWSEFSHYKLTLNCGSGTVHVDAYSRTNPQECHRLGVMFNDLPKNVDLYPMFGYVKGYSPIMIEYIATSDVDGQMNRRDNRRQSSAMCTVL